LSLFSRSSFPFLDAIALEPRALRNRIIDADSLDTFRENLYCIEHAYGEVSVGINPFPSADALLILDPTRYTPTPADCVLREPDAIQETSI
jgi:hypothetical protein